MNKKRKNNTRYLEITSKIKKIKCNLLKKRILQNKNQYIESKCCRFVWKKILSYLSWLTRQKFYVNFPSMYMWIERKETHYEIIYKFKDLKNGKYCLTCGNICSNTTINRNLVKMLLKNDNHNAVICSSSCLNFYLTQNNNNFRIINSKDLAKIKIYEYEKLIKIWNPLCMTPLTTSFLNTLFLIHKNLYDLLKYLIIDVKNIDMAYYNPSFRKYIHKKIGINPFCALRKKLNKEIICEKINKILQQTGSL